MLYGPAPGLDADEASQRLWAAYLAILAMPDVEMDEDDEESYTRLEASHRVRLWLEAIPREAPWGPSFLHAQIDRLGEGFLRQSDEVRNLIETMLIEHLLESAEMEAFFASWRIDPRLAAALDRCLLWGRSHR